MSLLLDALQRASKEKEKLAESRANSLGSSESKVSKEPSEERSPFPSLAVEKGDESKDLALAVDLSIEPMTTEIVPIAQPTPNTELAILDAQQEKNEELAVSSFAGEGSQPKLPPITTTNEFGAITPAVAEISDTLAVRSDSGAENLSKPEVSTSDPQGGTNPGRRGAKDVERATGDPSGRKAEGSSTLRQDATPSPQVAREILGATVKKRLPNRRVIALGSTALAVAGFYLAFHLGAFDQFLGKTGSSLTPTSPPPTPIAVAPSVTTVPSPAADQRPQEGEGRASRAEIAAVQEGNSAKMASSTATSKVVRNDDTDLANKLPEPVESKKPSAREAKARQVRPVLVARATPTSNLDAAYAAMSAGQLDVAADLYRKALAGNPAERDAFLGLAYISQRKGENEEAKKYFLQVLRIDPGNYAANSGLLTIAAEGDLQQAASRAREMAERAPDSALVMGALGGILAKEGRIAEAQQAYFRALTLEPDNAFHAFNLAVALDKLHKNSQALGYYQRALVLAEKMPEADRSGFPVTEARQRIEQLRQSAQEPQSSPRPDSQFR